MRESAEDRWNVHSDLGGAEAESRLLGVGPLWVDHQQTLLLVQAQVPACGDVANAEGLPPFHVAPAPAVWREWKEEKMRRSMESKRQSQNNKCLTSNANALMFVT